MKSGDNLSLVGWKRGDSEDALITREWLVTNGLGGYASGTIAGLCSRRFHGLLIAALPVPLGRVMMLNHLEARVTTNPPEVSRTMRLLGDEPHHDAISLPDSDFLDEFLLEWGMPVWRFRHDGIVLEKRLVMPHQQNTVFVTYKLIESEHSVSLSLLPSIHIRPHEGRLFAEPEIPYPISMPAPQRWELESKGPYPNLKLRLFGQSTGFRAVEKPFRNLHYRLERSRGYDSEGWVFCPGSLDVSLNPGEEVSLAASLESWDCLSALGPKEALEAEKSRRRKLISHAHPVARDNEEGRHLVLAADQFIISPQTRQEAAARAHAVGDDARTVIAGYHWFTDWGRDTMISLEGLTLLTGRLNEAGYILRTFASYVRDGLIPNMFPEGEHEGLYHTADATMWFFHAVSRYYAYTKDNETLDALLPVLVDIIEKHQSGTRFGIRIDPKDGLFTQGEEGYQLTWMDAKVDGWVVTPRRGKAVELSALYYNALRLLEGWMRDRGDARAYDYAKDADLTRRSFNQRFWYEEGGYLYDVIDGENGNDPALRPNQLLAISLPHPVLDAKRFKPVFDKVTEALLTPVGLRSLAKGHPDYKSHYDGDLRARDAAYHQGTVWSWLIGPYVDAFLKIHPKEKKKAREALSGFWPHLGEACVGSVSEVFDAEGEFTPRGCIAQAWGVAEALRCLVRTENPEKDPASG